jgi:hypothetical protein
MSRLQSALLSIALASLASCAALREPPIETDFEFDRHARFDRLESFDFHVLPDSAPPDERVDAPLFNARVQRAVQRVLEDRGFMRDASGDPDFLIVHYGVLGTGVDIQRYVDLEVYGYRPWTQSMRIQEIVTDFDEGTLILDIIDPRSQALMWRGYGETRVDLEAESAERTARLRRLVAEVLASFPPR